MSPTTLRLIIALVLFIHGAGHFMEMMPALGLSNIESWNPRSWLLTNILGDKITRIICFILFLAALIGFVGAALGWMIVSNSWGSFRNSSGRYPVIRSHDGETYT